MASFLPSSHAHKTLSRGSSEATTTADEFASFAADEPGDKLPFYEAEGQVFALWDRLNELKLETALLEAQLRIEPSRSERAANNSPDDETLAELKNAERECLEARAEYMLKQNIVENVLVAGPVLNAIHAGSNATATERTLQPLLDRRDILSIAHANISSSLESIDSDTTKLAAENLAMVNEIREAASELLALTDQIRKRREKVNDDPRYSERIGELREETKTARKRWRTMKSVVAATVAGSGVNWAGDDALRELVLDAEDEGE